MSWGVEFYEEEEGSRPVQDFLDSLPVMHRAKVFQRIQLLEEMGPHLDYPHSSRVEGKLRELRAQYGKAQYRILYYGDPNRVFVLLHGLHKRTKKIPLGDIAVARERMQKDLEYKLAERRGR